MINPRRTRAAADVAVGYAADNEGRGVAYASISTGNATGTLRFTFCAPPAAALDGREQGYAAVAELVQLLKYRGFGRVRMRLADARVAADLSAGGSPPKALAMAYVRARCLLRGFGPVRIEVAEPIEVRDLATRARAEVSLNAAA